MVKFSKELEAQLIPEWKHAFVNYRKLKKLIKNIKFARSPGKRTSSDFDSNYCRSIFYPFRYIIDKLSDGLFNDGSSIPGIIQVKRKSVDEEVYETELSQLFSEEDEVRHFFESLDEELNKVNQFFKARETEFLDSGETLRKQLQILVEVKRIIDDRRTKRNSPSRPSLGRNSDCSEDTELGEISEMEEVIAALERINGGGGFIDSATKQLKKTKKEKGGGVLVNFPNKDSCGDSGVSRKKIHCAEKMIRKAYVELYKGLGLLKTYSSLNMMAFVKILKKFDKVSKQQASASYLKVVKRSYFVTSDKGVRLMDEVESTFTQHFASNDRKKAMKYLRPHQQKDSHMVTFFVGLFTGCFVSLFSAYATLAHMSGIFSTSTGVAYMETVYPVFSMFALLSLHLFMYGCNLFTWKQSRINYNFIFEFQPTTALKYRDAFLICTTSMTAVVAAMVVHLLLRAGGFEPNHVDAIPGILFLIFIAILVCPLDIFYRPTRFCFIRVIRNIVFSPFYKVLMVDFFLADQITSQIPLLRYMESTACYFFSGSFRTHQNNICKSSRLYWELVYLISFLPYYWRAMQCARRWFDESDPNHLANMGKYVSAMVAAGARITFSRRNNNLWLAIVLVTSVVATVYQLYWDFVKDWGLLKPKSKNPWLRDELVLKKKGIYYVSIALNVVLRVAWVETILRFNVREVESRLLEFLLASVEVIRRGHWNFYRLENEHLNNVGKFRAVKTVPLPFRDADG